MNEVIVVIGPGRSGRLSRGGSELGKHVILADLREENLLSCPA